LGLGQAKCHEGQANMRMNGHRAIYSTNKNVTAETEIEIDEPSNDGIVIDELC